MQQAQPVQQKHQQQTAQTLIDLETRFWRSLVDEDIPTALAMLAEPSLMVSSHGAMKFDHAQYRKMAEQGPMVLTDFKLGDIDVVFPTDDVAVLTYRVRQSVGKRGGKEPGSVEEMADSSTWVRKGDQWQCVMHTETPLEAVKAH